MKKDNQALQRMQYLIKAAKLYEHVSPELSSRLIKQFIQVSEKKLIRISKSVKRKICNKCYQFKAPIYHKTTLKNELILEERKSKSKEEKAKAKKQTEKGEEKEQEMVNQSVDNHSDNVSSLN